MIKVAIMGFGTVGSGVAELIRKNSESISKKAGDDIEVKYILDIRDFPSSPFADLIVHDFETVVNDPEISVVAEVIGGVEPAYTFTKRCLEAGKNVVTSNKELVSKKGTELLAIAKKNNVNYMFEASVGGGIPIIRPLNQCLAANRVEKIVGILNGTTNFILTKMVNDGISFEEALAQAQANGYAEANPSADIDGLDSQRKIAILASLVFGCEVDPSLIHTFGIRDVKLEDIAIAERDGKVIKLIAFAKRVEDEGSGKVVLFVAPTMISKNDRLANVDDVFNGITIYGDAIGDVTFYGRGAGKMPTASAVVADIIDCSHHLDKRSEYFWEKIDGDVVVDYKAVSTRFYIRTKASDTGKALSEALRIFGDIRPVSVDKEDEIAFMTPFTVEGELLESIEAFKTSSDAGEVQSIIRVLE